MFVGSQRCPGLWGRKFYFVNKYLINACISVRGDVNSWARVTHESHEHTGKSPMNNDDSTVT